MRCASPHCCAAVPICGAVECARERRSADGLRCAADLEHAARAVDRGVRDQLDVGAVELAGMVDDHVDGVGPRDQDVPAADAHVGASEERTAERGGLDDRFGERAPARLLEDQYEVDHREPEPAVRFGREHADDAHLRELVPQTGNPTGLVRPRGAYVCGRALLVEELAYRVAERDLVLGERESHRQRLGSPSTRSAITLRWISFVPA